MVFAVSLLTSSIGLKVQNSSGKPDGKLTDQEKSKITGEIETVMDYFFDPDHLNYQDQVALRANRDGYVFAIGGKIIYADDESYRSGAEASYGKIQKFIESQRTKSFVVPLAEDAASCTTEFQSKYLTIEGDTVILNGCKTFVFKKIDDEWKIVQENGTHMNQ
jgi:hypothetical protein